MERPAATSRLLLGGLAVLAVLVVAIIAGGGSGGHEVKLTVPSATGLISGFDVRMAGAPVGSVKSVELTDDYKAKIVLKLEDKAWPLPADTVFRLRQAGTIHYSDRYVEIDRGKATTMIGDGATLPPSRLINPVEFDEVFNSFTPQTRKDLSRLLINGGRGAPGVAANLAPALERGPDASASAASVLRQLGDDPARLDTLVRSASAVTQAAATANPGVGDLVANAGATLKAVGDRSRQLRTLLDQTPATLSAARDTASRLDVTLRRAQDLTDNLGPGVDQLRTISPPLAHLLRTVVKVGPDARGTLSTLGHAAPSLTGLVNRTTSTLMPSVERIGRQAAPQVGCLRPYAPEISGLAVNWSTLWGAAGDKVDKLFRAQVGAVEFPNEQIAPSGTLAKLLPAGALRMSFPRPPGQIVNKSWYQPQCGITADANDIDKDPEYQTFDPLSKKIVDLGPAPPIAHGR